MRKVPDLGEDGIGFFERYWRVAKGDLPLPPVAAIDPGAFPRALQTIYLLDGDTVDTLRIRLAGTFYRELFGLEITGRYLRDFVPVKQRATLYRDYAACLGEARLVHRDGVFDWRERKAELPYRRLLMPFGADGRVQRIMAFVEFHLPD